MRLRCYACESEGISREHAPPQCIFPEAKDVPGKRYRDNLITVPACDEHNLRKSKDDEYLMMILVANVGNNDVANAQMETKVIRAWLRRPQLAAMAVRSPSPARYNGEETITFQVDLPRFERSMELIARAVTFHEHHFKWLTKGFVWSPSMLPSKADTARKVIETSNYLLAAIPYIFRDKPLLGSNPEVFQYRIHLPEDANGRGFVQLLFYQGFNVCVMFGTDLAMHAQSQSDSR